MGGSRWSYPTSFVNVLIPNSWSTRLITINWVPSLLRLSVRHLVHHSMPSSSTIAWAYRIFPETVTNAAVRHLAVASPSQVSSCPSSSHFSTSLTSRCLWSRPIECYHVIALGMLCCRSGMPLWTPLIGSSGSSLSKFMWAPVTP
jgi:hypothetical protein